MAMQPPAPGAEAPEQEGGDVQGQVAELVQNVSKGMVTIAEIMDKIPETAPEDKEAMAGLIDQFQGLIEKLAAGGGGGAEAAPASSGKSKAVPVKDPRGVPMGPGM